MLATLMCTCLCLFVCAIVELHAMDGKTFSDFLIGYNYIDLFNSCILFCIISGGIVTLK